MKSEWIDDQPDRTAARDAAPGAVCMIGAGGVGSVAVHKMAMNPGIFPDIHLASRTKAFKALDRDGNNLLTFEEWAAATGARFAGADANKDKLLTRREFATTAPKPAPKASCKC